MATPPSSLDLTRLLRPKSIAVFGGGWGERVVEQCAKFEFTGEIWPVHPRRDVIAGRRCYGDASDLPGPPDASFIAVNRDQTIKTVAQLSAMGAGGAVCFASGFREVGSAGVRLEEELLTAAGDMPILGPNCYGHINYLDGALLWPDQHGGRRVERGVAILAQSGNMSINLTMQRRALPIAFIATLGNQAQQGVSNLIDAMIGDDRVTAIGIYIEGIDRLDNFVAAAEAARAKGVPIVVLKSGASQKGAEIAVSHTGALAGADDVMNAFFDRLGIARVRTLPEFMETLMLLHTHGPANSNTIATMSCSGGEASMVSDLGAGRAIEFRAFKDNDRQRITDTVNPLVSVSNPFDYHTFDWTDSKRLEATYSAVLESGYDLTALIFDLPREDRCTLDEFEPALGAFVSAATHSQAASAVVASLQENLPEAWAQKLLTSGIAPLHGLEEALVAFEASAKIGAAKSDAPFLPRPLPPTDSHCDVTALSEYEAKALLRQFALPVPEGELCRNVEAACQMAEQLSYPVVMKAVGRNLLHKTECNGVRLNLNGPSEVREAFPSLDQLGTAVLVERMYTNSVAELIVGIRRDPVVGHYLLIGLGGVLTEIMADRQIVMLPCTIEEIADALSRLKGAALLNGYRGSEPADKPAIIEAISCLQAFAVAHWDQLVEVEINPLLAMPEGQGAWAVDALIRMREK